MILFLSMSLLVAFSDVRFDHSLSSLSNYTRWEEFNYGSWIASALVDKLGSASLGLEHFIDDDQQAEIVFKYLDQINKVGALETQLEDINFAPRSERAVIEIQNELQDETDRMHQYGRVAESILQNQTERGLVELGFGVGGQVFPPLLFKVTDLPLNLTVSPRDQISTLRSVSLKPGMDALEKDDLENKIFNQLDLSALVETVGGMGAYPSMVMRSSNINWLTEVIAHEWIHNYLSFFPMGVRYFTSDFLRSMNETTANLSGIEIGRRVMIRFYPAHIRLTYQYGRDPATVLREGREEGFNFRKQMRETRIVVDYLLSIGEIEVAEQYMEERRVFLWENGYRIRKINQAYFAFNGSYNDTPGGGAAGNDPVGPAVQQLRQQAPGFKAFIDEIKQVKSYEELLTHLE